MQGDPGPSTSYFASFPSTSNGTVRPPSPPGSPLFTPHQSSSQALHSFSSDALYSTLNLPREASEAEIRDRYRTLATTYHPDRQRDESNRRAAHSRFTEIQRAYEVLTDPTQRTIYDLFGEAGLRTSWDIGPRNRSPEEMRRHFQRQMHETRQLDAETLVMSKGDMSVVLDARAVFAAKEEFADPDSLPLTPLWRLSTLRTGRMSLRHSFESTLSDKTQVVWSGQMSSRSGTGGGIIVGTVRHQFSPRFWVEAGANLLGPDVITGKGTYTYDQHSYVTVNAVARRLLRSPPRISVTLGRKLFPQTTGFLTYKSGYYSLWGWGRDLKPEIALSDQSAMSVGLTTAKQNGTGWTVETQAGIVASHISADWRTKLFGLTVKVGGALSVEGITTFLDASGRITENVRAGLMLTVDMAGDVMMKLRISHLGQKFSMPILLSQSPRPSVIFCSAVLPAAVYATAYRFYLLPRKKRRIAERIKELRSEHSEHIAQKRAEAAEACLLMERSVASKVSVEREKQGLIIISAYYGLATAFTPRGMKELPSGNPDHEEGPVADVTIPVQALVMDSKLYIPGGRSMSNLLGFFDPCIGENKRLRVRYIFRDVLHEVTVNDAGVVRAPLQTHVIQH